MAAGRFALIPSEGPVISRSADFRPESRMPPTPVRTSSCTSAPAARGGGELRESCFLWPLPPTGPVTILCECAALGIPESRTTIDEQALREGLRRARMAWGSLAESDTG